MSSRHFRILVALLFAASPALSSRLAPRDYEGGRSRSENDRERRNESSVATILGEIRTNASDLMFIKTERYLHQGVAYVPHLDADAMASTGEIKAAEGEHHDHGEAEVPATIVKPAEEDFRGFIGDLERKVKPWHSRAEGDHHISGKEMLPWYRVMTLTDPHYIRGYLIGAWWLRQTDGSRERLVEAKNFISEGIEKNPDAFQLHLTVGYLLRKLGEDRAALKAFRTAADLASVQRPKEGPKPDGLWNDYTEEDACAAVRMAVLTEKEFGDPAEALRMAELYNSRFGGDSILTRQIGVLKGMSHESVSPEPEREFNEDQHDHEHDHTHDHD